MKTTPLHFGQFKDSFLHWQKEFGMVDFDPVFEQVKLKGAVAQIQISQHGRICIVQLTSELDDPADIKRFDPAEAAKHEALHLLLRRATSLLTTVGVTHREIEDTEEGLVRVLERLL